MQEKVKKKKEAKKRWETSGSDSDRARFKTANKEAKKAVAQAKAKAESKVYEELETSEGQKKIFRMAKARNKATKDFTHIKQMKDEHGSVLTENDKIKCRWESYFNRLLNEENPRVVFGNGAPNEGITPGICREEVRKALYKMKNGKACGPDEIPVEVWKSLGEDGVDVLWDLMQKIYQKEEMPNEWRDSVIVPIYKEKGDIQDCGNYRGIKLMSHTMKIWERIVERRIREETSIGDEKFGFMP